jgi:hypothetical protein
MASWKESARKSLIGDEVKLKTVSEELSIWPKKLSTEAVDTIADLQTTLVEGVSTNPEARKEYVALLARVRDAKRKPTEDEALQLFALTPKMNPEVRAKIYRAAFKFGVGKHTFRDKEDKLIGEGLTLDDKTIEEILEWDTLCIEMFEVIQAYNSPLPKTTSAT